MTSVIPVAPWLRPIVHGLVAPWILGLVPPRPRAYLAPQSPVAPYLPSPMLPYPSGFGFPPIPRITLAYKHLYMLQCQGRPYGLYRESVPDGKREINVGRGGYIYVSH